MNNKKTTVDGDYSSRSYWESRYGAEDDHIWYFDFDILKPLIFKSLDLGDSSRKLDSTDFLLSSTVLEIGCGKFPLLEGLNKCVNEQATNSSIICEAKLYGIDFSSTIVEELKSHLTSNFVLNYETMDARSLTYPTSYFDLVIDKGTIDAMLCNKNILQSYQNVKQIIASAARVMKPTSKFMIVSHMEHDSEEFEKVLQTSHIVQSPVEIKKQNRKRKKAESQVDVPDRGYGTVYIISSIPRKVTRNSYLTTVPINFKVLEYIDEE
eukprot:gene5182-7210_t